MDIYMDIHSTSNPAKQLRLFMTFGSLFSPNPVFIYTMPFVGLQLTSTLDDLAMI